MFSHLYVQLKYWNSSNIHNTCKHYKSVSVIKFYARFTLSP
jgi:hypothetical protein